ncbi:MAG: hypothetical protein A2Z21_07860 [Candidatus Fraserbacteria bacterium RBG_16_55_9]|uniref:Leucine-binding protein domain-containing protein n=1 Tax=Fraserbacteria sp. (strain RBG_16_55_9) TaxID=1817864 RepID=A0A1F5UQD3_FRAXR|nr:MAG: hypothetical protein A2Z21_07860 [Candidatus Fraserbacteria bacterium RBG_16_55_9]
MISRREFLKRMAGVSSALFSLAQLRAQATSEAIRIGLQADLTGTLADYGYWHRKVAEAAVRKLNDEGGIAGRPVELFIEDTASEAAQGTDKMRKLLFQDQVDIIIGSQHSGVSLASLPLAAEAKTVYFPLGEATEITAESGNRFSFKLNHTVRSDVYAAYRWAVENLGRRWMLVVADYAFGRSHAEEWPSRLREIESEVLEIIYVPLETVDFIPYLSRVDRVRTDVLFHVFPGVNGLRLLVQAAELGLFENSQIFGPICTVDGLDIEAFPQLLGSWYISKQPRRASEISSELQVFDRAFREALGVGSDGRELGTGRATTGSHLWYTWEIVHLLKQAIEATGWTSKADNPGLVQFLEGAQIKAGFGFPQGDKFLRAQDHQGFHAHYIERLEAIAGELQLRVKTLIPAEQTVYPATIDYSQQGF